MMCPQFIKNSTGFVSIMIISIKPYLISLNKPEIKRLEVKQTAAVS